MALIFPTPLQLADSPAQHKSTHATVLQDPSSNGRHPMTASQLLHGILCMLTTTAITLAADSLKRLGPATTGFPSATVVTGPLLWTSQILPDKTSANALTPQLTSCLQQLQTRLSAHHSSMQHIVRLHVCCSSAEHLKSALEQLATAFPDHQRPGISGVVTALPADSLVALDATALSTAAATADVQVHDGIALLPQGTRIFIAGQAEPSENLAEATTKTLQSLQRTLQFLGRSDADIVQLKAFVQPLSKAALVQQQVARFYAGRTVPPLVLVEWKSSASVPVEIELVAWGGPAPASAPAVEYLTPPFMTASPVYSRIARTNHPSLIFTSGLQQAAGNTAATADEAAAAEVTDIFNQLTSLLQSANSDLEHLVKATYYVSAEPVSLSLNMLRPRYYNPARPPAASKAMVQGIGPAARTLSMDMIAVPTVDKR